MAAIPNAALALDGGDPRQNSVAGEQNIAEYGRRASRNMHDSSVTFEEYLYWAKITREEEKSIPTTHHPLTVLLGFRKNPVDQAALPHQLAVSEKEQEQESKELAVSNSGSRSPVNAAAVSDAEWRQASRALRTATWGAVFYLITTDVLGPYSVPWAMSQMGYGPGVALYTVFGALAGYTGWQLWQMFLMLDSDMYPLKTYGDFAFRIFGTAARHLVNILQSIQLIFNVGIIIIGNGQGIWQINNNICFVVCCLIWLFCGFALGQVRTLQKFGWIANFAIWLNIVVLIMTMAVVANTLPNYAMSETTNGVPKGDGIVRTYATQPPFALPGFPGAVNGLMQAVYSYGGAMLYCEFMSEMRRPWDFWKSLVCAQCFIFFCYMFFGVFVYAYQGQYTINPANQGMGPAAAYTAGNIISFIAALIAAALYGNIGIKVLYTNVLKDIFGFPDLSKRAGKLLWVGIVPVYWSLAFIIAAAIPNFSYLSSLVAALCILQFTYTFPPLLMLGALIKRDAMQEGEGFDPATGQTVRHKTGIGRWVRGYMRKPLLNTFNLVFMLGALVTAGLGSYSAIEGLISAFKSGTTTSFSCSH